MTLRAAAGWNADATARVFQLTAQTIGTWTRRLDENGPRALLKTRQPVNKLPRFVHALVKQLRATLPAFGKVRIAQVLARAGLELSAGAQASVRARRENGFAARVRWNRKKKIRPTHYRTAPRDHVTTPPRVNLSSARDRIPWISGV